MIRWGEMGVGVRTTSPSVGAGMGCDKWKIPPYVT